MEMKDLKINASQTLALEDDHAVIVKLSLQPQAELFPCPCSLTWGQTEDCHENLNRVCKLDFYRKSLSKWTNFQPFLISA